MPIGKRNFLEDTLDVHDSVYAWSAMQREYPMTRNGKHAHLHACQLFPLRILFHKFSWWPHKFQQFFKTKYLNTVTKFRLKLKRSFNFIFVSIFRWFVKRFVGSKRGRNSWAMCVFFVISLHARRVLVVRTTLWTDSSILEVVACRRCFFHFLLDSNIVLLSFFSVCNDGR